MERPGGFALTGGAGLATPSGAEKLFVALSGIQIKGELPELAAATAELKRRLAGRSVSGAEIFAAARDLEAAYATAGYVLVRVVLPPQHLVNGATLKLTVVDGFIERIELKDVPETVRHRIDSLVQPLVGRRGITLKELERRVLLAGDTPGVILRSTLSPGKTEGATVLVIDAKYQAVSETLTFDNTLSQSLGGTTLGAGLDFNSIAGLGELIYLRASGHPDGGDNGFFETYPRNRILAAGFILPLWVDGLTFNAEYTDARTTPESVAGIQTTDTFERLSLRLRYAWLRGRSANFNSEVSFDAQDEQQSLFVGGDPVPLSLDRLRIVRFANDGDVLTPWGASISGRATASFGIDGLARAARRMHRRYCRCRDRAPTLRSRSSTFCSTTIRPCSIISRSAFRRGRRPRSTPRYCAANRSASPTPPGFRPSTPAPSSATRAMSSGVNCSRPGCCQCRMLRSSARPSA